MMNAGGGDASELTNRDILDVFGNNTELMIVGNLRIRDIFLLLASVVCYRAKNIHHETYDSLLQ